MTSNTTVAEINAYLAEGRNTSGSKFDALELINMSISSIYFLIGFPTNLLSIVVCLKSLFHKYILRLKTPRIKNFREPSSLHCPSAARVAKRHSGAALQRQLNKSQHLRVELVEPDTPSSASLALNSSNLNLKVNAKLKGVATPSPPPPQNQGNSTRNNSVYASLLHSSSPQRLKKTQNMQKPNSNNSTAANPHRKVFELYLVEISVCDLIILAFNFTTVLLLILSRYKLIHSVYEELVLVSNFTCKFIIGLNRTVMLIHNWLIATMAATRCYAIYKPLSSNTYFGSKFYFRLNLSIVFILLGIFGSINLYGVSLLSFSYVAYNDSFTNETLMEPQCVISKEVYNKFENIELYINLLLGIFGYTLPCLITLIINLVLIYNVRNIELLRRSKFKRSLESLTHPPDSSIHFPATTNSSATAASRKSSTLQIEYSSSRTAQAKNRVLFKATSSLLTLSFSYVICYVPYSVYYLLLSLEKINPNPVLYSTFTNLRALNHTLNFYIYFITGKRFRNDVKEILKLRRGGKN